MQPFLDFVLELDRLKAITRQTRPPGLDRYENAAEHSWHVALTAVSLAPLAAEPVNVDRVVRMLLIHDVGEIDTGDVMAYANINWDARREAERAAVVRIAAMLPDGLGAPLVELWDEFEARQTADARFAHAVDRALPALQNLANNGQSWRENGITYAQVVAKLRDPIRAGCPALWDEMAVRLDEARRAGWFGTTPTAPDCGENAGSPAIRRHPPAAVAAEPPAGSAALRPAATGTEPRSARSRV